MDDMASALGAILNNPQTMQQIMGLASQLGLGAPAPEQPTAPQATPAFTMPTMPAAAPAFFTPPLSSPPSPAAAGMPNLLGNIDVNTIARISQIMAGLNTRDENVELLLALKPHFGEKRRKKVDDAIRIMQLVKMLPMLKETGLFGSLFGGEET